MLPHLRLEVPPLSARVSPAMIASTLARLIASGSATTKADLVRTTGLARTTVDTGLRALFELGAIRMQGFRASVGRGRPADSEQHASPQAGDASSPARGLHASLTRIAR